MPEETSLSTSSRRTPWNKGKLIGAKPPLRTNQVWSIRTRFNDRGSRETLPCSIWRPTANSAAVMWWPSKSRTSHLTATQSSARRSGREDGPTGKFELTEQTRQAIEDYLRASGRKPGEFLFASRRQRARCMTTRQYARLVTEWIRSIGLDPRLFGTHSLRRTKATLIYRRTGNLRPVQLLLGHTKIESTVRYLGIEVDDALAIAGV